MRTLTEAAGQGLTWSSWSPGLSSLHRKSLWGPLFFNTTRSGHPQLLEAFSGHSLPPGEQKRVREGTEGGSFLRGEGIDGQGLCLPSEPPPFPGLELLRWFVSMLTFWASSSQPIGGDNLTASVRCLPLLDRGP